MFQGTFYVLTQNAANMVIFTNRSMVVMFRPYFGLAVVISVLDVFSTCVSNTFRLCATIEATKLVYMVIHGFI